MAPTLTSSWPTSKSCCKSFLKERCEHGESVDGRARARAQSERDRVREHAPRAEPVRGSARAEDLAVRKRERSAAVHRILREPERDVAPGASVAAARRDQARAPTAGPGDLCPRRLGAVERGAGGRHVGSLGWGRTWHDA